LDLSFNPLEEETLEELTGWAKENDVALVCSDHSDGVCSEMSVALVVATWIISRVLV
jgi:hypothetical protein